MNKVIAVTIGDIDGIGLDILLKTWKDKKIKNIILITNIDILLKSLKKRKVNIRYNLIKYEKTELNLVKNKLNILSYKAYSLEDNTYQSLNYAYQLCLSKKCIGMITLPLRKDLIKNKIDKKFIGHTEFFQKLDRKKYVNMILYHKKIIISPITTHIEVKKISKIISNKNFLYNQIYNLNNILKIDFNITNPRIIISGFNPHAGENGYIGSEEKKIISPVIQTLKNNGIDIHGPFSADSLLINKNLNKFDCFIFIYHDQALIPFKYISQFSGVNYTGNLDVIRTSPDHGTAYNLRGSKKISDKSFINCYKLINKINKNKTIDDKS